LKFLFDISSFIIIISTSILLPIRNPIYYYKSNPQLKCLLKQIKVPTFYYKTVLNTLVTEYNFKGLGYGSRSATVKFLLFQRDFTYTPFRWTLCTVHGYCRSIKGTF